MRDYLIFAVIFGLLPFILKRPAIGVLAYTWISLMNPHRLTYGSAYDFPFAALIAAVTFLSIFITSETKRLPFTSLTAALVLFATWTTITSFSAFDTTLAWVEWFVVMKTILMTLVAILIINNEKDLKSFIWVMALSLGFYGLKGGIFTLLSGGTNHVLGPAGSYITDNNTLALALIMALPIIWSLQYLTDKRWLRFGIIGLALLTIISIVGSYSRGALLGGAAMLFFLWFKSNNKIFTGSLLTTILITVFAFMPSEWFDRMSTIPDYQDDASAMGRINGWRFAINVATDNLMGGGFKAFTPKMFYMYAPVPEDYHVAHSIYFQVLGDHGFIGLALFLLLLYLSWRTGARIKRLCSDNADLVWASSLATMCQVSIIGYATGGAFLSMPYYDFFYYVAAALVMLEKIILNRASQLSQSMKYNLKTRHLG